MSKQREFTFIECGERVLCIDLDPVVPGEPARGRIRIFIQESHATLTAEEIEAVRRALTVSAPAAKKAAA